MFFGTRGEDGPGDGGAEAFFEGYKVAEATADCGDWLLWMLLLLGCCICIVFGVNGYQISPVGRTGKESCALDEHGIGHGDFSVMGIDKWCGGDIIGDGGWWWRKVIVIAHSTIF